eukprot:1803864-Pleurochrysis_carterae.AAC.1
MACIICSCEACTYDMCICEVCCTFDVWMSCDACCARDACTRAREDGACSAAYGEAYAHVTCIARSAHTAHKMNDTHCTHVACTASLTQRSKRVCAKLGNAVPSATPATCMHDARTHAMHVKTMRACVRRSHAKRSLLMHVSLCTTYFAAPHLDLLPNA